jgi:hypothetical protein
MEAAVATAATKVNTSARRLQRRGIPPRHDAVVAEWFSRLWGIDYLSRCKTNGVNLVSR